MELFFLIEPSPGGLKEIRSILAERGSRCQVFNSVGEALKSRESATIVVLLADRRNYRSDLISLKIHPSTARVPRISVFPEGAFRDGEEPDPGGETIFRLPVDREVFLDRVASMQKRSMRRVFEIVVNIKPASGNIKYVGKSLDFSRSGMAFECGADFSSGERLSVSFVDPRNRKRFLLGAEVVRKQVKLVSGTALYGVRFVEIGEQDVSDLMNFIGGKGAA